MIPLNAIFSIISKNLPVSKEVVKAAAENDGKILKPSENRSENFLFFQPVAKEAATDNYLFLIHLSKYGLRIF